MSGVPAWSSEEMGIGMLTEDGGRRGVPAVGKWR